MNPSVRLLPSLLAAAALAALSFPNVRADDVETSTIKFSDPSKPGTLRLTVTNGDLHIRGADAAVVTVRTELKPEAPAQRKDGLRVLTSSSSYSLTEKDNVVSLSYGTESWPKAGGNFDLTVPRNTSVVVSSAFGGDIDIGGVTGGVEVKSLNGPVRLADITGGALVETMNGEIHADIRAVAEGKPLSFTSMNGAVQLTLAPDLKASVSLRTHNGSILTDFDDRQLVTKTATLSGDNRHRGPHAGLDSADSAEIRAAVRDAVRIGMEAAREATRAARDAIREAKGAAGDSREDAADNADEKPGPGTPIPPIPPVPPLPPMTGGKIVTGTLNGGGPEIRVSTMNGDVTLRKAGAK